jgi:hypothetical protein
MINHKKIRESVGLTHAVMYSNPNAWRRLASSFNEAAWLLDEYSERIPSDTRPCALNAALSLELIFKAILAKKQIQIPMGENGHHLRTLCEKAGVSISEEQATTLDLMTEELVWVARYPAPKKAERFDEFHDIILESHIIREQSGNVYRVRSKKETFSNFENYERIWQAAVAEFDK